MAMGFAIPGPAFSEQAGSPSVAPSKPAANSADPQKLFVQGETALRQNDLENAEHAFKAVIAVAPKSAPAYANLGVVYMRRQQWDAALRALRKAEALEPKEAGI